MTLNPPKRETILELGFRFTLLYLNRLFSLYGDYEMYRVCQGSISNYISEYFQGNAKKEAESWSESSNTQHSLLY
jgi:hypothetical protein